MDKYIPSHNYIKNMRSTLEVPELQILCEVDCISEPLIELQSRQLWSLIQFEWMSRQWNQIWREVGDSSQNFSSDTLQGISSEWSGDATELDTTPTSTSFWRYPLKSVRRKALGWISYFTPSSSSVPPNVFSGTKSFWSVSAGNKSSFALPNYIPLWSCFSTI